MKTIVTVAVGMLLVGVMSVLVTQRDSVMDFLENTEEVYIEKEVIEEVVPEIELDNIEQAKADMERISLELDTEETKILEEKAQLKAEYEAKQAEKDARLESITEIRLSF